ncbi:MAG: hypothetical protein PHR30_09090 [Gallionellaceae bacterium]|nr:hypothetical protein [Gallionellaceae bacterium]
MTKPFLAIGLLMLAWCASAQAAETDSKAEIQDAALAAVVAESAAAGVLDQARTRKLLRAMFSDDKVDSQEQGLIAALMQAGGKPVPVSLASGQLVQMPAPDPKGRALLELAVSPVDMETLWLTDEAGMAKLIELAGLNTTYYRQVYDFVVGKLYKIYRNTPDDANRYEPLRGALSKAWELTKGLDLSQRRLGAKLLHYAMKDINRKTNNGIPDYLYDWLKPNGPVVTKGT